VYLDKEREKQLEYGGLVNKDILMYFILKNIPLNSFPIGISPSNLFVDKRRAKKRIQYASTLHCEVIDSSKGEPITVCQICNKYTAQTFLMREIRQIGSDAEVTASITCSGEPSSSKRILHLHFRLKDTNGMDIWTSTSPPFRVYHRRGRKGSFHKRKFSSGQHVTK
jgi:hypothetical protein